MKRKFCGRCAGLLGALCVLLTGCMTASALKLPSWQDFRRELLNTHGSVRRIDGKQYAPWLEIDIYYAGDMTEEEKDSLFAACRTFLSSEEFLDEYLPYARENMDGQTEAQPPLPDIHFQLLRDGGDEIERRSTAMYYTEPYRSDRTLTVDGWQTWQDWDSSADGTEETPAPDSSAAEK